MAANFGKGFFLNTWAGNLSKTLNFGQKNSYFYALVFYFEELKRNFLFFYIRIENKLSNLADKSFFFIKRGKCIFQNSWERVFSFWFWSNHSKISHNNVWFAHKICNYQKPKKIRVHRPAENCVHLQ